MGLIEAAKRDAELSERLAADAMVTVDEIPPVVLHEWHDLDESALGETTVTDEVN